MEEEAEKVREEDEDDHDQTRIPKEMQAMAQTEWPPKNTSFPQLSKLPSPSKTIFFLLQYYNYIFCQEIYISHCFRMPGGAGGTDR